MDRVLLRIKNENNSAQFKTFAKKKKQNELEKFWIATMKDEVCLEISNN